MRVWHASLRCMCKMSDNAPLRLRPMKEVFPQLTARHIIGKRDDVKWNNIKIPPMSDQSDITTLTVRPTEINQRMKLALVQLSHTYHFDGKPIMNTCQLNAHGFNFFLNGLAPRERESTKSTVNALPTFANAY